MMMVSSVAGNLPLVRKQALSEQPPQRTASKISKQQATAPFMYNLVRWYPLFISKILEIAYKSTKIACFLLQKV